MQSSREGEERYSRGGGGGAVDLVGAVESCRQSCFILRSTWRTAREDQEPAAVTVHAFGTRDDVAAVDSDRDDDRDGAGRTVRPDGGLDERQDAVRQEPAGLSRDQERSLRGLHGAVLLRTYALSLLLWIDRRDRFLR